MDDQNSQPGFSELIETSLNCGFHGAKHPNRISKMGSRIIGNSPDDTETDIAEFPWMILIKRKSGAEDDPFGRFATGSLIHPKVVLTAAHVLGKEKANNLKAVAGDYDIGSNDGLNIVLEIDVAKIVKHEEFNKESLHNNIALLIMVSDFELQYHIDLICLPPQGADFASKKCVVSGWGQSKYGKDGVNQRFLKKIDLPVVPSKDCETQLKNTNNMNSYWKLHESFICAGGEEGNDACTGDGGGTILILGSVISGFLYFSYIF